jgi:hypothetical protein
MPLPPEYSKHTGQEDWGKPKKDWESLIEDRLDTKDDKSLNKLKKIIDKYSKSVGLELNKDEEGNIIKARLVEKRSK